jgi:hypothetical protein
LLGRRRYRLNHSTSPPLVLSVLGVVKVCSAAAYPREPWHPL